MSYKRDFDGKADANNRAFLNSLGINPDKKQIINPVVSQGNRIALMQPLPKRKGYTEIDSACAEVLKHTDCRSEFTQGQAKLTGIDACFSSSSDCYLTIRPADCAVIFVIDPKNNVFGLIHVGTAGIFSGVISRALDSMRLWFGSNLQDIVCFASPSISAAAYKLPQTNIYKKHLGRLISPEDAEAYNPKEKIMNQLLLCGILPNHIELSPHCTASNSSLYFSHHLCKTDVERATLGRMLAIIGLRR